MSKHTPKRLVAATVLAVTLAVFTLPAAAAPLGAWTYGTWELPTFLSWLDSLWSGMVGEREVDAPTGPSSVHAKLGNQLEPDGVNATTSLAGDGEDILVRGTAGNP